MQSEYYIDRGYLSIHPSNSPNPRDRHSMPAPAPSNPTTSLLQHIHNHHLRILAPLRAPAVELALAPHLRLRGPLPQPHQALREQENNHDARRDAEHVADLRGRAGGGVEEAVDVDAAGVVGEEGEGEVQGQEEQQEEEVDPGRAAGARDDELEERERRVERVLADVAPLVVGLGPPGGEEDGPEDDRHQEGVADDGAVEEGVQGLQGAREAREERDAVARVAERVDGGGEEVEGQAPVGQDGEVGEGEGGGSAAAVVGLDAGED